MSCPTPGRAVATSPKLPAWASKPDYAWTGVGLAACITTAWSCLLRHALCLQVDATSGGHLAAVYLALVASYSGVFISAHDAMHGLVAPGRAALNNGLGRLFALLFAAFDYEALHTAHWQHHARPATHKDPDYHDGHRTSAPAWFLTFMRRYITRAQLLRLACAAGCLHYIGHVPVPNLVLFWAMPALTSALQLFVVGTYLPHRGPHQARDRHRARSLGGSALWSLVSCYNFGGCHYEHHRFPRVPWWRLHVLRAALQAPGSNQGR